LGFDVTAGQDIENAIKEIKGTSVANLSSNRNRDNITDFPTIDELVGSELDKLCKKDINRPIPQ
ncbi:9233_t:CDS:2, partial [Dentiscutata erythropus]